MLKSLNTKAEKLYNEGRYDEALEVAKKALNLPETVGPDHPSTATSLNNLAEIYNIQGKYTQAEPLYKRGCCGSGEND